jgi:hypothetical protein
MMADVNATTPLRVLVAGGGIAGLEGLLYDLRRPLHANSPEIRRLGRRLHGEN